MFIEPPIYRHPNMFTMIVYFYYQTTYHFLAINKNCKNDLRLTKIHLFQELEQKVTIIDRNKTTWCLKMFKEPIYGHPKHVYYDSYFLLSNNISFPSYRCKNDLRLTEIHLFQELEQKVTIIDRNKTTTTIKES
jgi:hypothetical protein